MTALARKELVGHSRAWLLHIFENEVARTVGGGAALVAVDEPMDVTATVERQVHVLENLEYDMLGDGGKVAHGSEVRVARVDEDEIGRPEEGIVSGEIHFEVDAIWSSGAIGHLGAMPWTARVERQRVVDDARVIVDEGAIGRRVVHGVAIVPAIRVARSQPQMIGGEAAGHLHFTEAHDALARNRVVGPAPRQPRRWEDVLRKSICAARVIARLDIEGDDHALGLTGDGGAVDLVIGDGIAAGAVIDHRYTGVSGSGIDAILERGASEPIDVSDAGAYHDRLVRSGKDRAVFNLVNARTGIGHEPAVRCAWRAKAARERERAIGLSGTAVEAQKQFWSAAKPAAFRPNGNFARRRRNRGGEWRRKNAVRLIIAARRRAQVQALGPGEGAAVFDRGKIMRSLQTPPAKAVLEAAVGDNIWTVIDAHFDFVQQAFAKPLEHDDEGIVDLRAEAFAERTGIFDCGPFAFGTGVTIGPIRGQMRVGFRIDEFETAAGAIAPIAPAAAVPIEEFAGDNLQANLDIAATDEEVAVVGGGQGKAFAAVG